MSTGEQSLRAEDSPVVTTLRDWPSAPENKVSGIGESLYFFLRAWKHSLWGTDPWGTSGSRGSKWRMFVTSRFPGHVASSVLSRLFLCTRPALGPILHKVDAKPEQKGVVLTLRYRKNPTIVPVSVGSVSQLQCVNGSKAHPDFIFCGNRDLQLIFAWSTWVWPLRKGISLAWAGFQQPLIKPQHCSIWQ